MLYLHVFAYHLRDYSRIYVKYMYIGIGFIYILYVIMPNAVRQQHEIHVANKVKIN